MPNVKYVYKCIRLYECFNNSEGDVEQVYATSSSSSWICFTGRERESGRASERKQSTESLSTICVVYGHM